MSWKNSTPCIRQNSQRVTSAILLAVSAFALLIPMITIDAAMASCDGGYYAIHVDLPPVVANGVVVTDYLPKGLIFQPDSSVVLGAATNTVVSVSGSDNGRLPTSLTWNFGKLDNSANQDLLIKFKAAVADTVENQDGVTLDSGELTLSWKDTGGKIHTDRSKTSSVKIIEPNLQVEQQFQPTRIERERLVTCTLTIRHTSTSHADAFDVDVHESLPSGLNYTPGSMKIVSGPAGVVDDSIAQTLHCHFDQVDQSWTGDKEIQFRCNATFDNHVKQGASLSCSALLAWTSAPGNNPNERHYTKKLQSSLVFKPRQPDLEISLADNPDPVRPNQNLTYTISYRNSGGDSLASFIQMSYDTNTQFVSSDPAPDQGTNNCWTLGNLIDGTSGTIRVTVRAGSRLPDGTLLASSATISCQQGASMHDSVFTRVLRLVPSLLIEKTASAKFIRPGGTLNYTISYQNTGNDQATNVTITDIVDSNLQLDPTDCNPRPSRIWTDGDGTHLWWNASILNSEILLPGDKGQIDLKVSLPSMPEHPNYDWTYNNYKIDSDESQGRIKTLDTAVIHSLFIRKKAEKQVYSTGELVNYTLVYGNDVAALDAENAVITDVLPDAKYMEYEGSEPSPTSVQGNVLVWNIGKIPAKSSGTIYVYAKMVDNHSDIKFKSTGSVSG